MKKNMKKWLSILLCLCLMASLLGTMAFAADTEESKKPLEITFLGTSVTSGFYLEQDPSKWDEQDWKTITEEWKNELHGSEDSTRMCFHPFDVAVPGSAPRLLSEELGIEFDNNRSDQFHNMCRTGLRTAEALWLLDENATVKQDWISEAYLNEGHYSYMSEEEVAELRKNCTGWIENSDIVVVELGSNDTMVTVIDNLFDSRGYLAKYSRRLNMDKLYEELKTVAEKTGSLSAVILRALSAAKTVGELPLMTTAMTKALVEGMTMFVTNYGRIIARIYELNPDATVVALGTFNPLSHIDLSDKIGLSAGVILDSGIKMTNAQIKTLAPYAFSSRYDYRYVDISGIGSKENIQGISKNLLELLKSGALSSFDASKTGPIHPNENGHKYIYAQIHNALWDY